MIYATPAQFSARYTTRLNETDLSSHFLPLASRRLDAMLALGFTVPFSVNNVSATDLTIDLAYLMILQRSRNSQEADPLQKQVEGKIGGLLAGREAMLTSSGDTLFSTTTGEAVWANDALPVFTGNK